MDGIQKAEHLRKKRASLQRHEAIVERLRGKEPFTVSDKRKLNREKYMVRKIRKAISNIENLCMLTEDYVSFETAKLLKEKGFDCACKAWYSEYTSQFGGEKYTSIEFGNHNRFEENYKFVCSAPTLQMAMKWLRKVHNLHCAVDYDYVLGWYCQITSLKKTVEYDYEEMKHYHPEKDNGFSSPEEAYEVAIKYCLENLI